MMLSMTGVSTHSVHELQNCEKDQHDISYRSEYLYHESCDQMYIGMTF